jgi:hypothetical protein
MTPLPDPSTNHKDRSASDTMRSAPIPVASLASSIVDHPVEPRTAPTGPVHSRAPVLRALGGHWHGWLREAEEQARVIREREAAEQQRLARLRDLGRLANAD